MAASPAQVSGGERDAVAAQRPQTSRVVAIALCLVVSGLILVASLWSGGYFAEDYLLIGVIGFVSTGIGLMACGRRWRPSPLALVGCGGLVAYTAWTGLSAVWSPDSSGAVLVMARSLGYVGVFTLALLAVGNGRHAVLLLRLVVTSLVVVSAVALFSRLRPDVIAFDASTRDVSQGRLAYPITYWNGLGAMAAMALVGAVGLASDARENLVIRALCAAGGAIAGATLYLTLSRGAGIALVIALTVVLGLSPRRLRLAASAFAILGGAAASALVLAAHPVLVDRPETIVRQADAGRPVLVQLLLIAVATGLVQVGLSRFAVLDARRQPYATRRRTTLAAGLPILLVLASIIPVYAVLQDRLEGRAASGAVGLRGFVDRQYSAFMDTGQPPPPGQSRLTSARSSRSAAYRVAIESFTARPLVGDGAGAYRLRWVKDRRIDQDFRNAHSLELETLSELGAVGGAALLIFLVPLVACLGRLRRRHGNVRPSQAAGAGGVVVVWLVHSALDWDWQLAAVTLPALACGAVLMAPNRGPDRDGRATAR